MLHLNRLRLSDKTKLRLLLASALYDLRFGCVHAGLTIPEVESAREGCLNAVATAYEFQKFFTHKRVAAVETLFKGAYSEEVWDFYNTSYALLDRLTLKQYADAVTHLEKVFNGKPN